MPQDEVFDRDNNYVQALDPLGALELNEMPVRTLCRKFISEIYVRTIRSEQSGSGQA
jgi:hypothetical protein